MIENILKKEPGYIGYLTAGDGGIERSKEAILALVRGGVNVLEVGVPFSDPLADGPVIQAAAARALQCGTTLEKVLQLIQKLKKEVHIPIVLFTYYNPILNAGPDFFQKAKMAGVDGCLVVDLPLEESDSYCHACNQVNIDPIFLISPSTPAERIALIAKQGRGMLYYVMRSGTTGIRDDLPADLIEKLKIIKSISSLPIVAGFGISNRKMAKSILNYADGFVVGSLFVKAVAEGATSQQIQQLAEEIDPRVHRHPAT